MKEDKAFIKNLYDYHLMAINCPSPNKVVHLFKKILSTLYPDFSDLKFVDYEDFEQHYKSIYSDLQSLFNQNNCEPVEQNLADNVYHFLPVLKAELDKDVKAIYDGDPAAKSITEVIRTYPGFYAIAGYRLAHLLYSKGLVLIPRIIAEHAHSKTGVDIHPGAQIGGHFCIDHGTGVVIGETTIIGNHVKIYQGVTLGALSVKKEDAKTKRHPTIEDNVVIYAGATILGGKTIVGHDSIIGGNVWITESVAPYSRLSYARETKLNQE